jgi:hypothetical protein
MNVENANGAPEAAPSSASPVESPKGRKGRKRRPYRARRYVAGLLVVLFSISLCASLLSFWGARQVLNTNVFVSHISTAIKDPAVQKEVADYVSTEVIKVTDPAKKIAAVLPTKAQVIVGPVVGALQNLIHTAVLKLVAAPRFQRVLLAAISHAHAAAVALLEGKTRGNLVIRGNEVVLNTLPLIDSTIRQLEDQNVLAKLLVHVPPLSASNGEPSQQLQQLSHSLGVSLPADFGQVVVFRSNTLKQAQEGLKKLHRALILMLVLTIVLFVLAIVVSPFKLRTVAQLGIGAAVIGLLTWAGTKWATNHIVQIAKSGDLRAAIRAIANAETHGLTTLVIVVAVLGIVAAVLAFIFGESPSAGSTRGALKKGAAGLPAAGRSTRAFILAHADGTRVVGFGVGLVILFIWLSWTAFFVAIVVVALWQLGISLMERTSGESTGTPPSGGGPAEAVSAAGPTPAPEGGAT